MNVDDPRIREAYLYKKLSNNRVQCTTCHVNCSLEEGESGICKTRKNIEGKLHTLIYGDISSYSLHPIEKMPAYQYYPGSVALTFGSWGCNINCDWCQNWDITMHKPPEKYTNASLMTPEKVVENANFNPSINGVCFSFNEPTLSFEFALDVFQMLPNDFYKYFVSNGYMTVEVLDLLISSGLNGMTVSFKGTENVTDALLNIQQRKIWDNLQIAAQRGIHLELAYLVIPTINDDEEFIRDFSQKVIHRLSANIPVHFLRYFPSYLTKIEKTSVSNLQKTYTIAKNEGLEYVYLGNIPGHPFQNTYCPDCSELLLKRDQFSLTFSQLTSDNRCPSCNFPVQIFPYRPQYINK
ncbi:MAG: AmmeMemoRadiSam system radical SAM enzyme [Candidatus Heimdallarchaeota archaeon]|nr:AmmeMemoRadiSam system radical SAM enzyme [Candidatus Heimdallarchaeota archaeon]